MKLASTIGSGWLFTIARTRTTTTTTTTTTIRRRHIQYSTSTLLFANGDGWSTSSSSSSDETTLKPSYHSFYILRHGQTDANAGGYIQGSSDFSRLTDRGKQEAEAVLQAFLDPSPIITHIRTVYVSPLTRAQETWTVLRQQLPSTTSIGMMPRSNIPLQLPSLSSPDVHTLEKLREINFYDWEGCHKDQLKQQYPKSWKAWKEGDPYNMIVPDSKGTQGGATTSTTTTVATSRYPLLELWERADQVWDEIFEQECEFGHNENSPSIEGTCQDDQFASLVVAHGSLGQALLGTAMGWDATLFRKHEFPNCGMAEIQWKTPVIVNRQADRNKRRPLASRWRWRWPVPSKDWM